MGTRSSTSPLSSMKHYSAAAPPFRVGRKQHKRPEAAARLPAVTPLTKCKLKLLMLKQIKDYLLMVEEFVASKERLKPHKEKMEEDRTKVDVLRGSPMGVGNLEERSKRTMPSYRRRSHRSTLSENLVVRREILVTE